MTSASLESVLLFFFVFAACCPLVGSVRQVLDEAGRPIGDSKAQVEQGELEQLQKKSSLAQASSEESTKRVLHPVVIVGPLIGQTLEVKDGRWGTLCSPLVSSWRTAWLPTDPIEIKCALGEHLRLTWDPTTNTTRGIENVQMRVAEGWQGLKLSILELYGHLVDRLAKEGYVKDVNLLPQPYDWRLSVHDWRRSVFPEMQKMIEKATKTSGQGVVLTGLSMAGPFTHSFLTWVRERQGTSWAATHIHAWVPIGAPWNGAVNALSSVLGGALLSLSTPMKAFDEAKIICPKCVPELSEDATAESGWHPLRPLTALFGDMLGRAELSLEPILDGPLTDLIHTLPSIYWLSTGIDESTDPPTDAEYVTLMDGEDERVLTASMMPHAFRKIHHASGSESTSAQLLEYAMSVGTTSDPGVPVHCVYGHNVRTFTHLAFPTGSDFKSRATVTLHDGDGTVHLAGSLDVCDRWPSTVKTYKFEGIPHMFSMAVPQVLDVVAAVATEDQSSWQAWQEPAFDDIQLLPYPTPLSMDMFRPNILVQKDHGAGP